MQDIHYLLKLFSEQAATYRVKELGDGTHDFTKKVLEGVFGLTPKSSLVPDANLFGEVLYDNFYVYEGSKKQGANARWDFRCKINGKLVVVETEKLDNIEPGMPQIKAYMIAEETDYGIVTDAGIWRFFKDGPDNLDKYVTLTIEQLCSTEGAAFLQNFYNSYDFYLQRLISVESIPFDTQKFHQRLITTAERVVFDLRHIGLFTGDGKEIAKEEIQTSYSLIIQLLLIKIVQDKRKIELLKKDVIIEKLKSKDRPGIFEAVEEQINWLGKFYQPYHNQQDNLLSKIIKHYQGESRVAKLNLDSIRLFLDLYYFIYSFDFREVKQDLFGAVYENYLKELYKEEDSKKGQVFTPPEIVEFMLDEVGYTVDYIQEVIHRNLPSLKENLDNQHYNINGLSLIDPACGSGTFLYKSAGRIVHALHNIRKTDNITNEQAGKMAEILIGNNIVGFDIEPFPLYLAEMNILQRLLFFNVGENGVILNRIDTQIKIFSTDDSIAEFHNLEKSMKKDLTSMATSMNLFTKRDNEAIFGIKADIQDRDPKYFIDIMQFEKGIEEIQKPLYMIQESNLLSKQNKSYWDKNAKLLQKKCTTFKELKDFIKISDKKIYDIFTKNYKKYDSFFKELEKKLSDLKVKTLAKRTKFDFVIANPPYIKYNQIRSGLGIDITETRPNMNNVYGINLHSIPEFQKKYSPKPNLYSYFNALSYGLVKEGGKVCFIVPEGFVAYDCNNRFLLNTSKLRTLVFFNQRIFLNRGILGNIQTATSAIVYSYEKNQDENYKIKIKNNEEPDLKKPLQEIIINLKEKHIGSNEMRKYISLGFSITKYSDEILKFLDEYNENSDSLSLYFDHNVAEKIFGSKYFFDIGYDINEKKRLEVVTNPDEYHTYFTGKGKYYTNDNGGFWPKLKSEIPLGQANQGYNLLDSQYKIILNKTIGFKNPRCRFFEDKSVIRPRNYFMAVGSNDITEIYYLFGLFNSSLTWKILDLYNKIAGEIREYSVLLPDFKIQIRVPKINNTKKKLLKSQLIENSKAIITLCKNGNSHTVKTRGDICETNFDADNLGEKIIGLKKQYAKLGIALNTSVTSTDFLPEDIMIQFQNETSDFKKLEYERDILVKKLYDLE